MKKQSKKLVTYIIASKCIQLKGSKNFMAYRLAIRAQNLTNAKKKFEKLTNEIGYLVGKAIL